MIQYQMFERTFHGEPPEGSQVQINLKGIFNCGEKKTWVSEDTCAVADRMHWYLIDVSAAAP